MKIHTVTWCWGDYVPRWLDLVLPQWYEVAGLQALYEFDAKHVIFTRPQDWPAIVAGWASTWCGEDRLAGRLGPCSFGRVEYGYRGMRDAMPSGSPYATAVADAWEDDAALVFLPPDVLFGPRDFARLATHIREGKRAVLCPRVRVEGPSFERAYARAKIEEDAAIIDNRQWYVTTALERLHPQTTMSFPDAERFTRWPSVIIEPGHNELVYRCYHMQALFVHPRWNREGRAYYEIVDYDLAPLAVVADHEDDGGDSAVHVASDSDEFMQIDLTEPGQLVDYLQGDGPYDAAKVAEWVEGHITPFHRWLFDQPYRFHV